MLGLQLDAESEVKEENAAYNFVLSETLLQQMFAFGLDTIHVM